MNYLSTDATAGQILTTAEPVAMGLDFHVASGESVTMRGIRNRYLIEYMLENPVTPESSEITDRICQIIPIPYPDISRILPLFDNKTVDIDA